MMISAKKNSHSMKFGMAVFFGGGWEKLHVTHLFIKCLLY